MVLPPPDRPRPPPRLPRVVVLRERVLVPRFAVLRGDLAAPVVAVFAVERFAGVLRAVDVRVAAPADDFARVADVDRFAVERFAAGLRAVDLRAAPVLVREEEDAERPLLPALAEPSKFHLPDITRWAASATASAMIEPSLVALETMLLAACDAVSAASSPASRIFFRAAGLAAIAAAAAVNPAASISLLIAALASFSTVLSFGREREEDALEPDLEEVEREELFRGDFAIVSLPASRGKTLYSRFGSRMKCEVRDGTPENVKGTAAYRSDALRHGQRPEMWPSVSF